MDYRDLTPEQMEKAKACTTSAELIALAQSEGVELTDDQLDTVAGGGSWDLPEGCGSDYCGMFD